MYFVVVESKERVGAHKLGVDVDATICVCCPSPRSPMAQRMIELGRSVPPYLSLSLRKAYWWGNNPSAWGRNCRITLGRGGWIPNRSCPGDFTCQTNQPIRKQSNNQHVLMTVSCYLLLGRDEVPLNIPSDDDLTQFRHFPSSVRHFTTSTATPVADTSCVLFLHTLPQTGRTLFFHQNVHSAQLKPCLTSPRIL